MVWSPVTGAEAVAVTVIIVPAASVPVLALTERLTSGKSLSVVIADTIWSAKGSNKSSLPPSLTDKVILVV